MEKEEKERTLSIVYLQTGRKEITLLNEKAWLVLTMYPIAFLRTSTGAGQPVKIVVHRKARQQ